MFLHFGILLLLSQGLLGEEVISKAKDGDSRIISGKDALPGMANYQVSIRAHYKNQDWHDCGGSILNEEYVLTAAHCVYQRVMKDMSIVVGSHMIIKGGDRYKIKKLITHEKYRSATLNNDIAIVQIKGKFKYSDKVQPIELLKEMAPIGKKCLFTGWGYINLRKRTKPNNLQMLEYETISNDDCNEQFKQKFPKSKLLPINAGHLCAKRANNKGACSGDSGGALVIQDDKNKTVQIGVVSWVVLCAKDYPDVFNSVHSYYDWIQSKIK